MLMSDHICMPGLGGKHPLVGHNDDNYGVRFPVSLATYCNFSGLMMVLQMITKFLAFSK